MEYIEIEEKYVFEYIRDILNSSKLGNLEIDNSSYHHNSNYDDASSIITTGILTLEELNRLNIKKFTPQQLQIYNDIESHINGTMGISLSKVGLKDLYKDEDEYNPFDSKLVDFVISTDIKAARTTLHYGNEFVTQTSITPEKFKSVDIRLLKYLEEVKSKRDILEYIKSLEKLISKYNRLKNIALSLKQKDTYIPFREMSYDDSVLDIDKLINNPQLKLKI